MIPGSIFKTLKIPIDFYQFIYQNFNPNGSIEGQTLNGKFRITIKIDHVLVSSQFCRIVVFKEYIVKNYLKRSCNLSK